MTDSPLTDWDAAYNNMAHVEGSAHLPAMWAESAAAYRSQAAQQGRRMDLDLPYGDHPRERFDLVWPDALPIGLAVFVHGGYWMRLDKSFWTDLAEGARRKGWAVCLPSYTLAPEVRISKMTRQIGRAVTAAAALVDGPIRLAGHSAGGHLVTRMMCDDSPLPDEISARITHGLSISGLHDLRPLLQTHMNQTLHLDVSEASSESAILHMPRGAPEVTAWVGGGELSEFIRQSHILDSVWTSLGAQTRCVIDGDHNHFTVIEALKSPDTAITQAFVGS